MATQVCNYKIEVDNKKFVAHTYFPGFTYDDFDRGGGLCPWKICRIFEAGRIVPFMQGNFADMQHLISKNFGFFVLGGDYYFDPSLWEVARKYRHFPYKVSVELINFGQTSMTFREVLTNTLDNKDIASLYLKVVYIDRSTKRPQELPYWHRMKYRQIESPNRVRIDSSISKPHENAFSVKNFVAGSDTDNNGHTNQSNYIRFCLDAAESAVRSKKFSRFTSDICYYPIIKISANYRGETKIGDELVTSVWEDDLSPTVLNFTIHRGDKLVFTSSISFKSKTVSRL